MTQRFDGDGYLMTERQSASPQTIQEKLSHFFGGMMDLKWERRVYQIVMEAQQRSPAELRSFLDDACKGDPAMRKEVEKRLEGINIILKNMERLQNWHSPEK
jgi:hypothetical protein